MAIMATVSENDNRVEIKRGKWLRMTTKEDSHHALLKWRCGETENGDNSPCCSDGTAPSREARWYRPNQDNGGIPHRNCGWSVHVDMPGKTDVKVLANVNRRQPNHPAALIKVRTPEMKKSRDYQKTPDLDITGLWEGASRSNLN